MLYVGARHLANRGSFFEPFTIGIVDEGDSAEVRYVFDFFDSVADLTYMDWVEAEEMLRSGAIPAYVVLPDSFALDIMTGDNTPFALYGNRGFPLQLFLTKTLAAAGVAFLSSSQAGIYATIDCARLLGFDNRYINDYIVLPINVAYVRRLLEYEYFFSAEELKLTSEIEPAVFFGKNFAVFLLLACLIVFLPALRGYGSAAYAQFRRAGRGIFFINAARLAGAFLIFSAIVFAVFAAVSIFTDYEAGRLLARLLALAFCAGAFGIASSSLFRGEAACGLFILCAALAMLVFAGGAVPLAYLPAGTHFMRYVSLNYWTVEGGAAGAFVLVCFGIIFYWVACIAEILRTRLPRAA
ncbi:MAG: ABC transporter permease [Defluviitaleaceae bacterium]|nr:ABC transporter permease [Defluviitaleaceae bacterium]